MTDRIVLTGATGNTGQVVAEELTRQGVPFVAMVRREASRQRQAAKGYMTVYGDLDAPESLDTALRGATRAYLVSTPDEHLVPRETAFIEAASRAGVERIVRCSAYLAGTDAVSANLRAHGIIDDALAASGISYTILRPIGFMQTFTLFMWDSVMRAGAFSLPAGDGAMPMVDVRDVAAVAVLALTEPGHEGKTYDLTGPQALTNYDIAELMARALDRPVTYLPGDERQTKWLMGLLGVPETALEHVLKVSRLQREHAIEEVHPTLTDLGIEPTPYECFLDDWIAGCTGGGNSFQPQDTRLAKVLKQIMPTMLRLRLRLGL